MRLKSLELSGFKSFGKKETLDFNAPISAIVGPNGSGKSNIAEAFRFVLGEQSIKSLRGKKGEDLIFNGGKSAPRANRAAVKVYFDNTKRLFDLDFDEVTIERVVHRDGVNQYSINGTQVRLRDILELLAGANIGSSGYHIISQGEADRVLNAHPRERREMIEDALGLRAYHFKLSESGKKLEKTRENIAQVEALRKEIAPHLRFLKKQVEKVERTKELRAELLERYIEYLKRESLYLAHHAERLKEARRAPEIELQGLERELKEARETLKREESINARASEIIALEEQVRAAREQSEAAVRDAARLEAELSFEERRVEAERRTQAQAEHRLVPLNEVRALKDEAEAALREAETVEDSTALRNLLRAITASLRSFIEERARSGGEAALLGLEAAVEEMRGRHAQAEASRREAAEEEARLRASYEELRRTSETARETSREAERRMFTIMTRQSELHGTLLDIESQERTLARDRELFEAELKEGAVLVGRELLSYRDRALSEQEETVIAENRERQTERRRNLERQKIRLEELGSGSGEEILKEYGEVEERDRFLAHEIEDLEKSAQSLSELIAELEVKLEERFKDGIVKINKAFQEFFALMFGGGTASLALLRQERRRRSTEEEENLLGEELSEEPEEGIDITLSLPQKRIKGLVMLSGGERALTSIALLFALSQVNPPPFLILDETDAALDEANSRRYGDMIENLAKYSQLILITHNRETMSRAGLLYGVTMGGEGISKILSVRFEEAVKVAK